MFYNLLLPLSTKSHIANLMTYITFRSGLALLLSLILSITFGPKMIRYLKSLQGAGQPIRDDGPASHFDKAGTPTMGGLMIIFSSLVATLLFADLANPYIWIVLLVMLCFGLVGFVDDYTKITRKNHRGISAKSRVLVQFIVSFIAFLAISYFAQHNFTTRLTFPFFKNLFLDLSYFYFPFAMCVIIGSANAVNLTDGLDGLAVGTIAIAVSSFGIISYLVGNIIYANYLQIIYVPHVGELTIFCAAIIGSSLGFLWYNAKPAEIFMGDTGSLSLGAALGTISVISKHEIVLSIIGGVFVLETVSVIMQVGYFKFTGGKRIFLMAPIHHHFEKKGWSESKVVIRFWILAIIFALIGLSSLKLR
ncbi:MAG: phospho-N-acetylmuramoyl-pentapeptide-transferase [Rickettsiaceae bacterium]|nr:phospho-N-acetylmuramoyl-pentapeptide-transferase [Rickettsiaceae bacterium]